MTIHDLRRTPWRVARAAARWQAAGQERARRNALVASTALARRREERDDVERFLLDRDEESRRAVPPGAAHLPRHTAGRGGAREKDKTPQIGSSPAGGNPMVPV